MSNLFILENIKRNMLDDPNLCILPAMGDGSCLIHSILLSYNEEYINAKKARRKEIAREIRDSLSCLLPFAYSKLGRGYYIQVSKIIQEYSLESMMATLRSDESLDYTFFEFICDKLNKDLYILDLKTKKPYITKEEDLYQKGRDSIIIGYNGSHYDLIGLRNPETKTVTTLFNSNHPLILKYKTAYRDDLQVS